MSRRWWCASEGLKYFNSTADTSSSQQTCLSSMPTFLTQEESSWSLKYLPRENAGTGGTLSNNVGFAMLPPPQNIACQTWSGAEKAEPFKGHLVCQTCGREFKTRTAKINHILGDTEHLANLIKSGPQEFVCLDTYLNLEIVDQEGPFLGLDDVVEFVLWSNGQIINFEYSCSVCDTKQIDIRSIFFHLGGARHLENYFKKYQMECARRPESRLKRPERQQIIKSHARNVELEVGSGSVHRVNLRQVHPSRKQSVLIPFEHVRRHIDLKDVRNQTGNNEQAAQTGEETMGRNQKKNFRNREKLRAKRQLAASIGIKHRKSKDNVSETKSNNSKGQMGQNNKFGQNTKRKCIWPGYLPGNNSQQLNDESISFPGKGGWKNKVSRRGTRGRKRKSKKQSQECETSVPMESFNFAPGYGGHFVTSGKLCTVTMDQSQQQFQEANYTSFIPNDSSENLQSWGVQTNLTVNYDQE